MKGLFINMILDPFEAIQADSFWYIIAFENFKRYFLRLLIHRQLHNFSGRRSWVLTLISMHPDVPMSLRLWVVTLWKPRTDLVVSHSLHLGSSCHLSKTAVCLYCGNLCTPNKCLGTVFTFHVTQPKKKFPPSEVLIPIGWCDFTPVSSWPDHW